MRRPATWIIPRTGSRRRGGREGTSPLRDAPRGRRDGAGNSERDVEERARSTRRAKDTHLKGSVWFSRPAPGTTNARSRSSSAFFLRDRRAAQVPQPTKPSATKQPITMPATARRLLKRRLARRAPSSSEWRAGGGSSVTRTASFTSVNAASQATTTCSTTSVRVLSRSASTFIVTVTERLASYRAKVLGSKIASSFREGSSVAAAASGRSSAGVTQTAPRVGVAPKRTAYVAS